MIQNLNDDSLDSHNKSNDMMKKIIAMTAMAASMASVYAQEYKPYGVERQFPVFLEEMTAELTYPMAWGNSEYTDFDEWRSHARGVLEMCMMAPPPRPAEYRPEVIAEEQREGYMAKIVQLNLSGYTRVNVYLLVPDSEGPHPGVMLFHDHGGHYSIGKEKMIRPIAADSVVIDDANGWAEKCYGGQFVGDYLASKGYVVICDDALFWGERGCKEGNAKARLGDFAGNLMGIGRCMSGLTTFEDAYLMEYFAGLDEVDADKIGCMGFSIGAYRSWMLAAYTDLVKAASCVCWMTTTDTQFSWEHGKENGGYANTLPMLRLYMDHPHVASIACPKPLMFVNGETDKLFPRPGVEKAYAILHETYASQGVEDRLSTEILDMPHYCGPEVQQRVLDFFDKWLK